MAAEALWMERNAKKVSSKLEKPTSEHSIDELIAYLNDNREVNFYVYVIVHNIDGPSLRDDDAQRVLANLAACGHVRFVASVDHVNSSLCMITQLLPLLFVYSLSQICWLGVL